MVPGQHIHSTSTTVEGERFALWHINYIQEPSVSSTRFQVMSQMQTMRRGRNRGGPCSQGYYSLIEKAETSRKHNKRLLVLNSEHVHIHSTITEAGEGCPKMEQETQMRCLLGNVEVVNCAWRCRRAMLHIDDSLKAIPKFLLVTWKKKTTHD